MPESTKRNFEVFKRELLLTPRQVRVRLLERMEEFLASLDPFRNYPFDFIFYHITGHRPEAADMPPASADEVAVELAVALDEVGRTIRVAADSIEEKVLTVDELSRRWGVSGATVLRWRRHGLASRFFTFGNGRRRVGVRESLARRFETDRVRLIRRARSHRRPGVAERRQIIEQALVGLAREAPPVKIIDAIAERFTLKPSKVQRIIASAAKENPALLPLTRARISRSDRESIYHEVAAGAEVAEVARRWGRSAEGVRRIYRKVRARALGKRRIRFIYNAEFDEAGAGERILDTESVSPRRKARTAPTSDLPVYLKGIAGAPLLEREEEAALFRKYNYLKFLAAGERGRLDPSAPEVALLDRIEALLAEADRVRERLVRSNLRLVVSIARRHHGRRTDFASLVSDGNVALLDAIEAFDYSRGNRFSTYAGWAIMRRFARTVPEENYRLTSIEEEILENCARVEVDYTALAPAKIASGLAKAVAGLPERERVIIERRFGLGTIEKPSTLQELGKVFGVTKERIRQIEAQALERLRSIIKDTSPELAG